MGNLVVGMADCKISSDPDDTIATYGLGSCLGVALYDRGLRMGGILHFMLPSARVRAMGAEINPYMYGDTGMARFLEDLCRRGADKTQLEARLAGGANMLQASPLLNIGHRNCEKAMEVLRSKEISVFASSVGGLSGRSMSLRLRDGQVAVQLFGWREEIL